MKRAPTSVPPEVQRRRQEAAAHAIRFHHNLINFLALIGLDGTDARLQREVLQDGELMALMAMWIAAGRPKKALPPRSSGSSR